ncbi:hypothetical protein [Streptomyces cyaneofuscatus]|uniref:hypothetical protein n=1 Tax=Streptomyces cyaneofuscatus TaxID=66883 RepID=UPI0037F7CB91
MTVVAATPGLPEKRALFPDQAEAVSRVARHLRRPGTRGLYVAATRSAASRPPPLPPSWQPQQTSPQLRPGQPVTCAALIVNHQHRLDPAQRPAEVYQRRVVDTPSFPVIASGDLFRWWRTQDWPAVQAAVLGQADSGGERDESPSGGRETPVVGRRRWLPWGKSQRAQ